MNCRHCGRPLGHVFLDLGFAPPSNAYLDAKDLLAPEQYYPLKLFVCDNCWLVQTEDHAAASELFAQDYAYFSSVSKSWLEHSSRYARMITERLSLGPSSLVVEIACNDGYLLRNFVEAGVPCLGIEPTAGTAQAAARLGIPVLGEFFGEALGARLCAEGRQADLVIGNNVLAHVPDINDFARGIERILKPGGTVTLEFPHLMRLVESTQFDTAYHEHFSYLSLGSAMRVLKAAGLRVFDVEELPTHGGSLRIYGCRAAESRESAPEVAGLLYEEQRRGMGFLETYLGFQPRADRVKNDLVAFLIDEKRAGRLVAGYGAAAKGNTLLNYGGVKPDLLPFVVDAAPSKQGRFLPGSHIPVLPPAELKARRPDVVLILPWNIADEVVDQQSLIREWGGRFATAVPTLRVW